jgi:energy-coupling factor transport system ATP-binding protein
MENLRYSQSLMSRRLAETMGYFGIDTLFDSGTAELSGGQKQAVALAAVTAMNPRVIILDEPTSQLDPVAASEFLTSLKKLNDEFGITVIITEHRAENVIPLCNKLAVMENGTVTAFGEVRDTISKTAGNERIFDSMPGSVRLWYKLGCDGKIPLTVREGRNMISSLPPEKTGVISEYGRAEKTEEKNNSGSGECALKVKNLYFRYTKESPDALRDTSLTVNKGEIMCMLGANGSGKSTLLAAVSGLVTPYSGKIEVFGKNIKKYTGQSLWNECVALLPQDAQCLFVRSTLKEELEEVGASFDIIPYDLSYAAGTHPYDLSGGEIQLAALAKVMASKPKLLLLDEPTKGLDSYAKNTVVQVLRALKDKGITVLAVTHDVEFAAMCSDRVALLFRGEVTAVDEPHGFFADNIFYTTSINKICRDINPFIIRPEDMI